jgi:hypothetical protein
MVTRFYLPNGGTAPVAANAGAGWSNPGGMVSRTFPAVLTKSNTPLADRTNAETGTTVVNFGQSMHVSTPLAAQTIAGTFSAVQRCFESAAAADIALQAIVRIISGNGATVRATLYAGHTAALGTTVGALGEEFGLTPGSTRIIPAGTALTSGTAIDGDRLSVELGVRVYNTVATSYSFTNRLGDPAGVADFALTSGLTTDLCPWVELSQTLLFLPLGSRRIGNRR